MKHLLLVLALFLALPARARAEEKEISIEEFLQGLSSIPGVVYRKDPFVEAPPPFEIPKPDESSANAPVLERYPAIAYTVVAVLVGEQYPRALIRLPASEGNKVMIVREKDKLGNKHGVITKIAKEGVTVSENQRSPLGFVDKAQVVLPITVSANPPK